MKANPFVALAAVIYLAAAAWALVGGRPIYAGVMACYALANVGLLFL